LLLIQKGLQLNRNVIIARASYVYSVVLALAVFLFFYGYTGWASQ
jgi:hypothetical protein